MREAARAVVSKRVDPETREQWQVAVNGAHACLVIDSMRQFGLATGGPEIDLERCLDIIARGAALGVHPEPNCDVAFVALWNERSDEREAFRRKGTS